MKRKTVIGQDLVLFSLSLIITSVLLVLNLNNHIIVSGTLSIVLLIKLLINIINNRSELAIYNNKVNKILKTYDSVVKRCNTIPNLEMKKIIKINDINILLDNQSNIENYIYCLKEETCCSFFMLKEEEILLHTIKFNENSLSAFEQN